MELKERTELTSERILGISTPPPYSCSDIDSDIKDLKSYIDDIYYDDEKWKKHDLTVAKDHMEESMEKRRATIEDVREWGNEWKALAKDLFDKLQELAPELAENYLTKETIDKLSCPRIVLPRRP